MAEKQEKEQSKAEVQGKLLRTVLRSDIYDRLKIHAQSLSTGRGDWDFGVAIERLLDYGELFERTNIIEARLEVLESEPFNNIKTEVKEEAEDVPELLGGYSLKGEKKNGKN